MFLVSDPFSDFLLEHNKQGDISEYVQQLIEINSHDDFEMLVDDWREKGMHNDDTTLVIVEDDQSEQFSIRAFDEIGQLIKAERIKDEKQKGLPSELNDSHEQNLQGQQDNEEKKDELEKSPCYTQVDEDVFRVDFLTEYKKALQKKHPHISEFKFKWTQKAIAEAINIMFTKYFIFIK